MTFKTLAPNTLVTAIVLIQVHQPTFLFYGFKSLGGRTRYYGPLDKNTSKLNGH